MDAFEFIDNKKDQVPAGSLHLSVQLCLDYCTFALQQKEDHRLFYLKHIPFDKLPSASFLASTLRQEMETNEHLRKECGWVKVIWISPKYTFVPEEMYREDQVKQLYELAHPLEELDELHVAAPNGTGYRVLFNVPQDISHEISRAWPSATYYNQVVPFCASIAVDRQKHPDTLVYTENFPGMTDIIVYRKQSIVLANAYATTDKNDWLYCMMNVLQKFEISQARASVATGDHFLAGLAVTDSVTSYFKSVRTLKPDIPQYNLSIFQAQDAARFVNLLNLVNCA